MLVTVILAILVGACGNPETTLGERIYLAGEGRQGRIVYSQGPGWFALGQFGCASCHAADGNGRLVQAGKVAGRVPPITARALAARGYDAMALRRAIQEGVSVEGRTLGYYMPRWQLDAAEMRALIVHIEQL